jgi:hypothetical protein
MLSSWIFLLGMYVKVGLPTVAQSFEIVFAETYLL